MAPSFSFLFSVGYKFASGFLSIFRGIEILWSKYCGFLGGGHFSIASFMELRKIRRKLPKQNSLEAVLKVGHYEVTCYSSPDNCIFLAIKCYIMMKSAVIILKSALCKIMDRVKESTCLFCLQNGEIAAMPYSAIFCLPPKLEGIYLGVVQDK